MPEAPPPDMPGLGDYRYWKPEAQQRALELLHERERNPWKPFYCPKSGCDGHPHGEWKWEHARQDQHPPKWSESWLTWLLAGGRGSGKTRTGSEVTHRITKMTPRIILIAPTGPDLRETMVEGVSGLLATASPNNRPIWEPSKKKLTWPNGCIGQGFSAEEPDRLRGPQCLVAGTMVETETGPRPIEQIVEGERVWTRHGLRTVVGTASSAREVVTWGPLRGTPDHPIWTETRGWVRMDSVSPDDTLRVWNGRSTRSLVAPTATQTVGTSSERVRSTSRRTAPSPRATRSTTATVTDSTTDPRTSKHSPRTSIESGTGTRPSPTPALAAVGSSSSSGGDPVSIAPSAWWRSASSGSERLTPSAVSELQSASAVVASSTPAGGRCVAPPASTATERVYDLTVVGDHEFFANGVLVHNSGYIWADEPAHYPDPEQVMDNALFGLRMGRNPKVVATTTPKPTKWMKALIGKEDTVVHRVSTYANIVNLADTFKRIVLDRYEGTRLGKQELHGEVLEDVEGALWTWEMIHWIDEAPHLQRIVVGVDPAGTATKKSDETGIIVIGIGLDKNLYVLHDATGRYSPQRWAETANSAYDDYSADAIVPEKNYGGDMVKHTLENAGYSGAHIIPVNSRRGKQIRAEPIVALYEKRRVFHVGERGDLAKLEDEMTSWVPGEGDSPNRVDALVHGITELAKQSMPSAISDPNKLLRGRHAPVSRHLRAV